MLIKPLYTLHAITAGTAATMVSACLPAGGGEADAGGGSKSGYLTDLPNGWRQRCASAQIANQLQDCADLAGATGSLAERITFELNLQASERGIFPRGLEELHFSHGRYAGWTVADLRTALENAEHDPARLDELVVAVNRAFLDGHDAGALARWVSTALCSTDYRV